MNIIADATGNGIVSLAADQLSLTRVLAVAFFRESGLPGEFNWQHWLKSWEAIVAQNIGRIFVYFKNGYPVGVIGGLSYRCLNTGDPEIIEAFWFILDGHRNGSKAIRLLECFEGWGRAIGAKRCKMAHLQALTPEVIADIYRRRGYTQQETCYAKPL